MDDSAIRAGKLAGLLLMAAGFSGCVLSAGPGKIGPVKFGVADNSKVLPRNQRPAANANLAAAANANEGKYVVLAAAADGEAAAGTPTLEIPEIPIHDPFKPPQIQVPYLPDPATNEEPARLRQVVGTPSECEDIPELPVSEGVLNAADEAPGKVFIRSSMNMDDVEILAGPVDQVPAEETPVYEIPVHDAQIDDGPAGNIANAPAYEPPGRAFISNYETPVVVYQEMPVAVPANRWPGHNSGGVVEARRPNIVKRQVAVQHASTRGIVRYVDKSQDSAQIVFAGWMLVQPGTRIAVRHQLLYGRLASTEYLEVVSAEPGVAIVRPIGNAHIVKTAIGDPVIVMNQ